MSAVLDNIRERRSIRKYTSDPVPADILDKIAEAGIQAASGMNKQSTVVIRVTNKEIRQKLVAVNSKIGGWAPDFNPFYGAPVIFIVLGDASWRNTVYDGSLVLGNMMLAAHDLGVGSCWIHRAKETFEMPEWKEWLKSIGVEGEYEGIGHLAVGYAAGDYPKPIPRREGRIFHVD